MSFIKGKTVLLTGGSSGIGLAVLHDLLKAGANVHSFSRSEPKLEVTQENHQGQYKWHQVDVQDKPAVQKAVGEIPSKSIDILINNASLALGAPKSFWEQGEDEYLTTFNTNCGGYIHVTHAVLKHSLIPNNKGTVLNITSTTALEATGPGSGELMYHSTKAFQEAFTKALRNETRGTDIKVLSLRPGFVGTHFHLQRVSGDKDKYNDFFAGVDPLIAQEVSDQIIYVLNQPTKICINTLEVHSNPQRSMYIVDRDWNNREHDK